MPSISVTGIEANVLRHRLDCLSDLDAEDLAWAAEMVTARLCDGRLEVTIGIPDTLLVLVEAAEGATIHERAAEGSSISLLKQQAYRGALTSAAQNIEFFKRATIICCKMPLNLYYSPCNF